MYFKAHPSWLSQNNNNNNMRGAVQRPLQTRWVEESLTPCSLCGALHSAASQLSDTEDPLCHHYHAAWSQETLFQKGRLIFSLTIREWLKNRHQTGLIKNRRRLQKCVAPLLLEIWTRPQHYPCHKVTTGPSSIPKLRMWSVLFCSSLSSSLITMCNTQ